MWEPRRLANLWASSACYRDSFTFLPSLTVTCRRLNIWAENNTGDTSYTRTILKFCVAKGISNYTMFVKIFLILQNVKQDGGGVKFISSILFKPSEMDFWNYMDIGVQTHLKIPFRKTFLVLAITNVVTIWTYDVGICVSIICSQSWYI
jgi:hypothetical protein